MVKYVAFSCESSVKMMDKTIFATIAFCGALMLGGAAQAITATDPAPRYNFKHAAWWFDRFDKLRSQASEEGDSFKIVFLGDSITENWVAPGKEVWKRTFEGLKYKAINCGFGGGWTDATCTVSGSPTIENNVFDVALSGYDNNRVGDPLFASAASGNFAISSEASPACGYAVPIVGVTTDIAGAKRNARAPTCGACEFDAGPRGFVLILR